MITGRKMRRLLGLSVFLLLWNGGNGLASSRSLVRMQAMGLPNFPNPFARDSSSPQAPFLSGAQKNAFQSTPEGLIAQAKVLLAVDLGVKKDSLLDDSFIWIGPSLGSKVLGKQDYIAAGKFFDLRSSFPDLDYRAHDFRIDSEDPFTVKLTARVVGTMRGSLRLRDKVFPPNGKLMQCPPEAITITFEPNEGLVTKLCSGFTMDRLVGNTGGVCGVMAAATVAGAPPSEFEIYPVLTVLGRFFGRPVRQLPEPASFLAPFPETVMIQLAKGILASDMAALDPDLLSPAFTYCGSYLGPINKKNYLADYASQMFDGTDPEFTYFRVDPYDPYRVWVDVRPLIETEEGDTLQCAPQAMSFTFDDDGFCMRLTADYVTDPSLGDGGGLGGVEGINYALGTPSLGIATRSLPQVFSRLNKRVFSPFTKIGVDDYVLEGSITAQDTDEDSSEKVSPLETISQTFSPSRVTESLPVAKKTPAKPGLTGAEIAAARAAAVAEARRKAKEEAKARFEEMKKIRDERQKAKAVAEADKKKTGSTLAERFKALAQARQKTAEEAAKKSAAQQEQRAAIAAERKKVAEAAAAQAQTRAVAITEALRTSSQEASVLAKKKVLEANKTKKQLEAERVKAKAAAGAKTKADLAKKQRKIELAKKQAEQEAAKRKREEELERAREAKAAEQEARKQDAQEKRRIAAEAKKQGALERAKLEEGRKAKAEAAQRAKKERELEAQAKAKAAKQQQQKDLAAARQRAGAAEEARKQKALLAKQKAEAAVEAKKQKAIALKQKAEAAEKAKKQKELAAKQKAEEARKKKELAARQKTEAAEKAKKQRELAARQRAEAAEKAKKQKELEKAKAKAAAVEAKARAAEQAKKQAELKKARFASATQSIGKKQTSVMGRRKPAQSTTPTQKSAPRGVPTLTRWRKNRDGSITGFISGSKQFDENERITTSSIAKGDVGRGNVVQTQSGSKYFLN